MEGKRRIKTFRYLAQRRKNGAKQTEQKMDRKSEKKDE